MQVACKQGIATLVAAKNQHKKGYRSMKNELLIIRGLPGSGKTTMAKKYKDRGYRHHEADHCFENANGEYNFNPDKIGEAHARCFSRSDNDLSNGYSVVVSNTFIKKSDMTPYEKSAKSRGRNFVLRPRPGIIKAYMMFRLRLLKK